MGEGGGGGGEFPPKKDCVEASSGVFPAKTPARQLDFTAGSDEHSLSKAAPTVVSTAVKTVAAPASVPSPAITTARPPPAVGIGQVRPNLPVVMTPHPPSQSQILNAPIRHP